MMNKKEVKNLSEKNESPKRNQQNPLISLKHFLTIAQNTETSHKSHLL
jgi:hypothetical protein